MATAPPSYYAEYSKRETRLVGNQRSNAGTYESPGTGRDTDGDTALMIAQRYDHTKIVELLIKAGATE